MNTILSNICMYQPVNWKIFKLYMFENMKGNISFIDLLMWEEQWPIKMLEWKVQIEGAQKPNHLEDRRWLGHIDFILWPPGFPVSDLPVIRVWLWPFIHRPWSFTWLLWATGPEFLFCTWKPSTDLARCFPCVCMKNVCAITCPCINIHTLYKVVIAHPIILLLLYTESYYFSQIVCEQFESRLTT